MTLPRPAGPAGGHRAGAGSARLHPREVRLPVWIDNLFHVSKLELAGHFPDLPTVTWTGRYREVAVLALAFEPRRRPGDRAPRHRGDPARVKR